jgi:hypothetical protein
LDVPVLRRAAKRLTASGAVVDVEVEGEARLAAAESLEAVLTAAPAPDVRLLPAFDPWTLVALRHLDRVLLDHADADAARRVSRPQGWISPVVAVDGRIVATWSGDANGIVVEPLGPLPRTLRTRLDDAAVGL